MRDRNAKLRCYGGEPLRWPWGVTTCLGPPPCFPAMWFDVNETLSHNALLNFVLGPRGAGKTFSSKKRVIKNFLKDGSQFVYLRRYDTELNHGKVTKFFDDIRSEFPNHDLVVNRSGEFICDDSVMGWPIPLSKAAQFKSVPFPDVTMIIFDEFIIDQGLIRYLPSEVETFNEMYSTIARLRDVKVLFLSNAITYTNPYFLYYGLEVPKNAKIFKRGDILVQYFVNEEYVTTAQNTRFGRIIQNTEYAKYAIQNEFLRDSDALIEKLPAGSKCRAIIKIESKELGIYSTKPGIMFISSKYDKTAPIKITADKSVNDENYLSKDGGVGRSLIMRISSQFYSGTLRFTDFTAKNLTVRKILGGV